MEIRKARRVLAFVFLVASVPGVASAELGGDAASVEADRVRVQGALLRLVRNDAYTLHEMQSASGVVVREYVSPAGRVFAVAWQGPWHPDLRQLLGPYFLPFQTAAARAQQNRKARGSL